MSILEKFEHYLVEKPKIYNLDRLETYMYFMDIFLNEFLAEKYPKSFSNPGNLKPDETNDFINNWLIKSHFVQRPEDLEEAGKALRHFIRFLAAEGRLDERKKKELVHHSKFENYEEVFETLYANTDIGILNSLPAIEPDDDNDLLLDALVNFIKNEKKTPEFVNFLRILLHSIIEESDGIFPTDEMDIFSSGLVKNALKESKFDPIIPVPDFEEILMLNFRELSNWDKKKAPKNTIHFKPAHISDPEEIRIELVLDILELLDMGFFTLDDFEYKEELLENFDLWIEQLNDFPANMWVKIPEGSALSGDSFNEPFKTFKDIMENPLRDIYETYFVMSLYWSGLILFDAEDGKISAMLKTRLGNMVIGMYYEEMQGF